jgi:hypothetical protein
MSSFRRQQVMAHARPPLPAPTMMTFMVGVALCLISLLGTYDLHITSTTQK